jgi:hypothetical protein
LVGEPRRRRMGSSGSDGPRDVEHAAHLPRGAGRRVRRRGPPPRHGQPR